MATGQRDNPDTYRPYLNQNLRVVVNRPLGSKHPRHGFEYSVSYGFLPDTTAGDGHEIDVYILDEDRPMDVYEGRCIAVIWRADDVENKLVASHRRHTAEEILQAVDFVERAFDVSIELAPPIDV